MTQPAGDKPICDDCGSAMIWESVGRPGKTKYWRWRCGRCRYLLAAHKLRPEQWDAMVASQGGACAICGNEGDLVIDHDHSCCRAGKSCEKCRRGLLCNTCNRMIGLGQDDPRLLASAISYLLARRPS